MAGFDDSRSRLGRLAAGWIRRAERLARGIALLGAVVIGSSIAAGTAHATSPLDSLATLLWTAPGDDGMVGRATRYELRMRTAGIAGIDTASWWSAATPVGGLPTPGVPGSTDSVTVRGLDPAVVYYFMVRTADEVPNWSGFSNLVVRSIVVDTNSPAAVSNLSASAPAEPALNHGGGSGAESRGPAEP